MVSHNFTVWAYVIMPEHVHLMIYPRDDRYSISKILKSIKISVSKSVLNRLRKNDSPSLKRMETGLIDPKYRYGRMAAVMTVTISALMRLENRFITYIIIQ